MGAVALVPSSSFSYFGGAIQTKCRKIAKFAPGFKYITRMKISIINGPNLNLVGVREPEIYGHRSLSEYLDNLVRLYPGVDFDLFQSNHEGAIIDEIQRVGFDHDGIVLNAGAYTHYSIAIADALRAVTAPAIEVHISDTQAREPYRHVSMIKEACVAVIAGYGLDSYRRAVDCLLEMKNTAKP